MRKVSFPYMGASHLAFKSLMRELGNEPIVPPKPSLKTLNFGTRFAPEFACLPYKILLGTYVEVLEMGADTIAASGGVGPCRAGHYAQLHRQILTDAGYKFEMIVYEPPSTGYRDFVHKIQMLNSARLPLLKLLGAINRGWAKIKAFDRLEELSHWIRPRETVNGETSKAYRQTLEIIDRAESLEEIKQAEKEAVALLKSVPHDPDFKPLKVGIVGEIYVLLEPSANLEIEETLGEMGVEVHRSMFLSGWTRDNTLFDTLRIMAKGDPLKRAAQPYLAEMIGGHGQDSVGHTVLYAKEGYDGVIQLAPFTCIPEIVAKSVLPAVSRDLNIPVLSLSLDEQTGKEGVRTRLEAFVDLLARRREIKANTRLAHELGGGA